MPTEREGQMEVLLRMEDWRLAFLEYPSLLDMPAVKALFELQPSCAGVISAEEEADYRANLSPGESKILGSSEAFPLG